MNFDNLCLLKLQIISFIFLGTISCTYSSNTPVGMVLISPKIPVPCGPLKKADESPYKSTFLFLKVYPFYIDVAEVTNKEYEKFINDGGYNKRRYWSKLGWKWKEDNNVTKPYMWKKQNYSDLNKPVVGVSFYEAKAYANWAGKRLPSEVEWEVAARGTDARYWPWGNDAHLSPLATNTASYWEFRFKKTLHTLIPDGELSIKKAGPTKAGAFLTDYSPYGCYDMFGNVMEWCISSEELFIYRAEKKKYHRMIPWVAKGCSWEHNGQKYTLTKRSYKQAETRLPNLGFRCVMDVTIQPTERK